VGEGTKPLSGWFKGTPAAGTQHYSDNTACRKDIKTNNGNIIIVFLELLYVYADIVLCTDLNE